jgi:hypothetical protein
MLDQLYGVAAELGDPNRSMDDIYHDQRAFHLASRPRRHRPGT